MSYSTNGGASWTVPLSIYTPSSLANQVDSFIGACQTNASPATFFFEWLDSSAGAGKYHLKYTTCTLISTGVNPCASATTAVSSVSGTAVNFASAFSSVVGCTNWPGFECANQGGAANVNLFQNGVSVFNATGGTAGFSGEISFNGNFYVLVLAQITGTTGVYYTSTTGAKNTWSVAKSWSSANGGNIVLGTSISGLGAGFYLISSPSTLNVVVAYIDRVLGGNCAGSGAGFCIETVSIGGGGAATTTVAATFGGNQCSPIMTQDTVNWAIVCANVAQSTYAITTNNGLTYTAYSYTTGGNTWQSNAQWASYGASNSVPFSMGAFPVVEVSTSANYNVYVQMFGTFTGTSGGGTTNVTLGSCPTKNTATFALTNSTEFFYTGTALGGTIVSQISAEVASVNSGHVASETLYFMLYSTGFSGSISATNPLFLINVKTWTLSATSSPQLLSTIITSGPGVMSGATYGIAILGNTKILINQSSLSGMSTAAAGGSNPGTPQSSAITSLTSTTTELFFCANANYQNVVTTTVTTTSTVTSTSTTTVGSAGTTTTTVTSLDQNAALTNSVNYVLVIFMVLGPAVILSSMGALLTKSAALTGTLFIAGMTVGAGAGNLSGIVPFNILALVIILIVFMILGLLMIIRAGGGSSGG